jgi:hypothetical protein
MCIHLVQAFRTGWMNCGQIARYIAEYIGQPSMKEPVAQPLDDFIDAIETVWKAYVSNRR